MKKLIILLFAIFLCAVSFGQDWSITQNIGSANTKVQVPANGGFVASLINRNFLDTSAANLTPIRLYPGGQIFTTSDSSFWLRRYNQWVKQYAIVPSGGGGTPSDTVIWRVSGNGQTIVNSLSGGGIGSANNVPVWFITNGQIRIQLPASGLTLSNDTTSNKVFTFNPSTKEWGYANWVGGGGSGGSGWGLTGNAGTTAGTNFIGTTDAVDFVIKTGIAPNQVMRFSGDGNYRTNIGLNNVLGGIHSLAVGNTDTAIGNYSLSFGLNSKATGSGSLSFGSGSKAIESAAIAFSGGDAEGVGSFAHAGTATGEYALSIGLGTASGDYSAAIGGLNTASGFYSFAIGNLNIASGQWAAAFGGESEASGNYSFAQGHEARATGVASIAMGNGPVASGYGATAFGKGYENARDSSFTVGFGEPNFIIVPDSAKFEISNFKIGIPSAGSGKVLVSDASGNATWSSTVAATSVPLSGITTSLANNIVDGGGFRFGISNNDGIHLTSATTADTLFTIGRTGSNPIVRVDSSGNTYFTGAIFGSANSSSFDASGNMRITGSGKYASFQTGAFIEGYQNKLVFKRSYPLTNDSIGFKITNDTLNASGASGTVYYPFVVASKSFSTDVETEKFKVRQDGRVTINDGTAVNGYVLTTDANGNASWQAASGGITSLNGLTGATQTFTVSGQGLTISSSGTTHTFTSSDFTTASKSSDQSSTAIALENCTDLSFSADANATYEFEGKVIFTADASTTGIAFNMNGPSASFANTTFEVAVSGTGITFGNSSAFSPTAYYNTTSGNGTTPSLMIIKGLARTTASGTIQFKFMPEAGSGGTVTVKQYSILKWRKIP